jgi:hypothetical protein
VSVAANTMSAARSALSAGGSAAPQTTASWGASPPKPPTRGVRYRGATSRQRQLRENAQTLCLTNANKGLLEKEMPGAAMGPHMNVIPLQLCPKQRFSLGQEGIAMNR